MSDDDAADDRLLAELAAVVDPDPVPPDLVGICKDLSVWADVDAELAELLDSEESRPAGVRSAATADPEVREFQLDGGAVVIDVEIGAAEISGMVLPAPTGEIRMESITGDVTVAPLDALGRFSFIRPDGGVVRLRLQAERGPVVTDWFAV